jgi:hypothetical protein
MTKFRLSFIFEKESKKKRRSKKSKKLKNSEKTP